MHLCTLVFIYSYISLSIHIPLYHLCIISFMRFYHDLTIHVLSIVLSCMFLLIHVFLSCSIYLFMYDNHIFISCHLLVTSYILLTYIFTYSIRLSYLMTYTYLFIFFISKKTNILKEGEVPRSTQEVDKRNQPTKTQKPKNYLLPNQVRKSTTEFVLSTLDTLAQVHKLVTKFDLIF